LAWRASSSTIPEQTFNDSG
jgi:hypothetical protein